MEVKSAYKYEMSSLGQGFLGLRDDRIRMSDLIPLWQSHMSYSFVVIHCV